LASAWTWLAFEATWECAAAVPAPSTASIAVMSKATVANKMMCLIGSHFLSHKTFARLVIVFLSISLPLSLNWPWPNGTSFSSLPKR
jgi:hypothetical protein